MRQLDRLKVPRETCDAIASSGDVTRHVIIARKGQSALPYRPRARPFDLYRARRHFAPLESADYVVCSGLDDDETETPEDYPRPARTDAQAQAVHGLRQSRPGGRARRRGWSIARARSLIFTRTWAARCSTPASPIGRSTNWLSEKAEDSLAAAKPTSSACMAIGDSVRTDLAGAARLGHRLAVHDRRHSCRGTGRARQRPILKS